MLNSTHAYPFPIHPRLMALVCVAIMSAIFPSAHAHTVDSVGEYRLELQWEVELPYSGEVNALKLFVSPLVPGLELEEQPFLNGVEGLEDTLKVRLSNRDYYTTFLLHEDEIIPGLYRAYVKVLLPGYYQVDVLGHIENTTVSLSLHPHEVLNSEFITFPPNYGDMHDMTVAHEDLRADLEEVSSAGKSLREDVQHMETQMEERIQNLEVRMDELAGDAGNSDIAYAAAIMGAAGMVLGGIAVFATRRHRT